MSTTHIAPADAGTARHPIVERLLHESAVKVTAYIATNQRSLLSEAGAYEYAAKLVQEVLAKPLSGLSQIFLRLTKEAEGKSRCYMATHAQSYVDEAGALLRSAQLALEVGASLQRPTEAAA